MTDNSNSRFFQTNITILRIFALLIFLLNTRIAISQNFKGSRFDVTYDNEKIAFCYSNDSLVHLSDVVKNINYLLKPEIGSIVKLNITDDNKYILMLSKTHKFCAFNLEKMTYDFNVEGITDFAKKDSILYTSGIDGNICYWKIPYFSLIKKLTTHQSAINAIWLSTKTNNLVIAGKDSRIVVLDIALGKIKKEQLQNSYEEPLGIFSSHDESEFFIPYRSASDRINMVKWDGSFNARTQIESESPGYIPVERLTKDYLLTYSKETNYETNQLTYAFYKIFKNKNEGYTMLEYSSTTASVIKRNNKLYYLSGVDTVNLKLTGVDIEKNAAMEFSFDPNEKPDKALGEIPEYNFKLKGNETDFVNKTRYVDTETIKGVALYKKLAFPNTKISAEGKTELLLQQGYVAPVEDVIILPGEKAYVTISESPVIKFWDAKTGFMVKEVTLRNFAAMRMCVHPSLPLLALLDVNFELFLIETETYTIHRSLRFNKTGYFDFGEGELDATIKPNFHLWFDEYGNYLHYRCVNWKESPMNEGDNYEFEVKVEDLLSLKEIKQPLIPRVSDQVSHDRQTNQELRGYIQKYSTNGDIYANKYRQFGSKEQTDFYYEPFTFEKNEWEIHNRGRKDTLVFFHKTADLGAFIIPISQIFTDSARTTKAQDPEDLTHTLYVNEPRSRTYRVLAYNADSSHAIISSDRNHENLYDRKKKEILIERIENNKVAEFTEDGLYFYNENLLMSLTDNKEFIFDSLARSQKKRKIDIYKPFVFRYSYLPKEKKFIAWNQCQDRTILEYDLFKETGREMIIPKVSVGDIQHENTEAFVYVNHKSSFSRIDFSKLQSSKFSVAYNNENKYQVVPAKLNQSQFSEKGTFFVFYDKSNTGQRNYNAGPNHISFDLLDYQPDAKYPGSLEFTRETAAELSFPELQLTIGSQPKRDSMISELIKPAELLTPAQRLSFSRIEKKRETFINDKTFIRADTRTPYEYSYLAEQGINQKNSMMMYSALSSDSMSFAKVNENYAIICTNTLNDKQIKKFSAPPVPHYYFHFLPNNKQLLSYGMDGAIRLWDINSRSTEPTVTYLESEKSYVFYTPDNYYKTSSRIIEHIKFRKNGKIYNIEQFDLKYNRPDIVLQRSNAADTLLIKAYYKAYQKRLKKMNFTEEMLKDDIHLPDLKIKNLSDLPEFTDSLSVILKIRAYDDKYLLDRINIYVNGVPVHGMSGINLRTLKTADWEKDVKINLSYGSNNISVSVLNQTGAESYLSNAVITCKATQNTKPDLYLVTIGGSKYEDKRYDLTYAAKDAEDIKKQFTGASALYNQIHAWSLTDTQVTKDNILKIKNNLFLANSNDVIIVTFAGHGVLDQNLDYYIATYEMDFTNPRGKGLSYDELVSLLDSVKPLKKVMLLDACHSGEIDKEEVQAMASVTPVNDNIKFRSAGYSAKNNNMSLQSVSSLMGELFSDLRKGCGATIISSAGGVEYTLERDQWKNGVLTYFFLSGLKEKKADINGDGIIMLSELQSFLRSKVSELSGGAQQPTSRIENLSNDFRIW